MSPPSHLQRHTNETRVIILMTDAENITGWPEPDTVAETLRPLGIRVHCVQILSPEPGLACERPERTADPHRRAHRRQFLPGPQRP